MATGRPTAAAPGLLRFEPGPELRVAGIFRVLPLRSRTRFRVRFGDIDPAGIVYYPTLVHYTHVALEDFFEQMGVDYSRLLRTEGIGLPTVHLEMDFLEPLRYGDHVEILSTVEHLGETSLRWRHELFRETGGELAPEPCAVARIVTVCVRLERMCKEPIPAALRPRDGRRPGARTVRLIRRPPATRSPAARRRPRPGRRRSGRRAPRTAPRSPGA